MKSPIIHNIDQFLAWANINATGGTFGVVPKSYPAICVLDALGVIAEFVYLSDFEVKP
jgi:hypothetical protein